MGYWLRCSLWLPLSCGTTFAFFQDPLNLPRITPAWLGFEILTKAIVLRPGCEIDYHVKWAGVKMGWKTVIEAYEPPRIFVDRCVKGPYKAWRHLHTFREMDGGTLVEDEVRYELPLGVLGRVAHWGMVKGNLREIFEYRQKKIAEYLLGERKGDARVVEGVRIERDLRGVSG